MHPLLFTIPLFGGLPVHTYGVLVALGFLAGMTWVRYEARRVGENPDLAVDLVFYIIVAAILGSRVYYVFITDFAHFKEDPLSFFRLWEGGLTFHGGLAGAVLVAFWFLRRNRRSFIKFADIFAPGVSLGHTFGRLGCFMVGCCHGRPVGHDAWWALVFPQHPRCFAPWGVPLYPTQPAEAIGNFCIFLILVLLRKRKQFDGQVFAIYLMLYGLLRFVVEMYRGDATKDPIPGTPLSMAQGISVGLLVLALIIWRVQSRKGAT